MQRYSRSRAGRALIALFGRVPRPRPSIRWRLPFAPYALARLRACSLSIAVVAVPCLVSMGLEGWAEGGGCRTRGRSGSSAASVVSLAETHYAEGSGSSRRIDLRAAAVTTPRRTARYPPRPKVEPRSGVRQPAARSRYATKYRRAKLTECRSGTGHYRHGPDYDRRPDPFEVRLQERSGHRAADRIGALKPQYS